ncbi:hypothetical protein POKO110462_06300 [Pontibacter korlensis]
MTSYWSGRCAHDVMLDPCFKNLSIAPSANASHLKDTLLGLSTLYAVVKDTLSNFEFLIAKFLALETPLFSYTYTFILGSRNDSTI